MPNKAKKKIALKTTFYRDNYTRVLFVLLLSILVNAGLVSVVFWKLTHPPQPRYFATSVNDRITPLFPLGKPNQSDSAVLQWANQAAIAMYSYNWVNFRQELRASSEFFTSDGWDAFLEALTTSNILNEIRAKKLVVSAVATRAPVILQKGVINGRYSWRVQMPILVTFQSAGAFDQRTYVVTMLIRRVSTLNSPRGIGISQIIMETASVIS